MRINKKTFIKNLGMIALALLSISVLPTVSSAAAVDVYLKAEAVIMTMPDGKAITMWAFADCGADSTFTTCTPASSPGPMITAAEGDTLSIHLRNNLGGVYTEPVSVVIPGQNSTVMAPVKFTDGAGRQRVKSFTAETAVGAVQTYVWDNLKPGTFLYQSGTHPSVQVQMGLYGALVVNPVAVGQAYNDVSTAYDVQAMLLYSEIDPTLHHAVVTGNYGPTKGMKSTVGYQPRYFLINGEPYSSEISPLPAGISGNNVLLRFLNAGLETHVPVVQGPYINIIAEDGNLLPYPKQQYSILLPAGKTMDVIATPQAAGNYAVYDRRLKLTSGQDSLGGMLTFLNVGAWPFASAAPGLNDFGKQTVGIPSLAQTFTVSNTGSANLTLGALAVTGANAAEFSLQNDTCTGATLIPASSCTIDALLTPATNGIKHANLVVNSTNVEIPTPSVKLSGCVPFFADVPAGYWAENYIYNTYCAGVTVGCGGGNFCPEQSLTRAQMMVFILQGIDQSSPICTGNVFNDVNATTVGDAFCRYIEKAGQLNITYGCGGGNFCPDDLVTRAQMMVFILTALNQPPAATCTGTKFNDVNAATVGDAFCRYIEQAATLGITWGCGGGNFCPNTTMSRATSSVFISNAFLQ
jgi:FtsP/CotA-like multicopper oxidase with cupredoxin domain